jgi:hypothetical protein
MPSRKAARSAIAFIAVIALLFCQAVWAGMLAPERLAVGMSRTFGIEAAAPTCHDLDGSDLPGNAAPSPCDSAQLPSDELKPPVWAPAVMVVASGLHFAPESDSLPLRVERAPPAGVPPPLRLLHCRFRH